MDRAKKERRRVRMNVTRIANEVDQELAKEVVDREMLRAKFERLEQFQEEIHRWDREVMDALLDADTDDQMVDEDDAQVEEYAVKISITRQRINRELEKGLEGQSETYRSARGPEGSVVSSSTVATTRKFKLPKIELKKFSGELKEWLGWWAQFSKIHEDDSLEPTDKFQYLYQSTVEGSKARQVLDAYPQSEENYPKVIDKLKERFGREKILKRVYVRELLKLVNQGKVTGGASALYYALDSHTRSLASLGITTEQSAEFLYPMVESCLPEDLLIVWQRHPNYAKEPNPADPQATELSLLLEFLRVEVENEEQRKLTMSEGSSLQKKLQKQRKGGKEVSEEPTSAGLFEGKLKCLFCEKSNHQSHECFKAHSMSLEDKRKKIQEVNGCFNCFKKGHRTKDCKASVRCSVCTKKHYHFMCPELPSHKKTQVEKTGAEEENPVTQTSTEVSAVYAGLNCSGDVLLKTVLVHVRGKGGNRLKVRLLFDEGSQRSYVTSNLVKRIGSEPMGQVNVRNVMIDGSVSTTKSFSKHQVTLESLNGSQRRELNVRERPVIGGILPRAQIGKWKDKLHQFNIKVEDHRGAFHDRPEIDILVGGDYREELMTGKRVRLGAGIFAVESIFGWMMCGPMESEMSAAEFVTHEYLTGDITQLWNLEVMGIRDSAVQISVEERERKMKEDFLSTVTRDEEGRYVIKLPWIDENVKDLLPTNESVCVKRIETATSKLYKQGKFVAYDGVFKGWEQEGLIEIPTGDALGSGHYLPHRPVFKESLTTPVRPVFDASCQMPRSPSLNQCLEKGPNWLELIPSILMRFRKKRIGVTSDIRKAFQMIGVANEDRKFQKFFWWNKSGDGRNLQPYQHCRVVFGMTCSPFILAAILDLHLSQVKEEWTDTAEILKRSLYVDNCVTSFDNESEYQKFKEESVAILEEAKMELRQWESNLDEVSPEERASTVLGLKWDKLEDTLHCQVPRHEDLGKLTKRKVLSLVAQIFEPIGYTCPALLQPKVMLQEAWSLDLGWDDEWDSERGKEFFHWYSEIKDLEKVHIPRNAFGKSTDTSNIQIHVFTDASQVAYAAVVFVRVVHDGNVMIQLINAKARVAPLDKKKKGRVTIPRLELMGCLVGARLYEATGKSLKMETVETYFWTDSSTALAWIRREGDWGKFVGNRVRDIVKLTGVPRWRHVPGVLNPADLPSRGCSPQQLLASKWWEGPNWLRGDMDSWPHSEELANENLVNSERIKTSLIAVQVEVKEPRFSSYLKNVRVMAWVRRFLRNSNVKPEYRVKEPYFREEAMREAELDIIREVQKRHFDKGPNLKNMDVTRGEDGVFRVQSRLTYKTDTEHFRQPILLPKEEPIVHQLVHYIHRSNCHGGTQFVLGKLREKYWITQGRSTVGKVIRKCVICRRHRGKCLQPEAAPLPQDRVETKFAFQTTGVDLAGPLVLKGGEKSWIVLYTCAVYRGIHLDLVTSLSTEAFLASLERFVNVIGRPSKIYSDHGTNFVGAKNLMKLLDWTNIEKELQVREIRWTFNPPAAPWWGGWWERLVRSTKELLRKMLGTAQLTYEELLTCLAAVSGTINDRPLTTLTEDGEDLIPLTPRMFMRDLPIAGFPEGVEIGPEDMSAAFLKLQAMKDALKARFRKEYLALLVQKGTEKPTPPLTVGDVVLIGDDNKKRFQWPIGRIVGLEPGRDGKIRVAKVRIANKPKDPKDFRCSVLARPLQRLYPLEMSTLDGRKCAIPVEVPRTIKDIQGKMKKTKKDSKKVDDKEEEPHQTRGGRLVKKPQRYGSWNY